MAALHQTLLDWVAKLPAAGLFWAMALLPLAGVPVSPFWIAIGIKLGPIGGSVLSLAALPINFSLGYWSAARWVRRWIRDRLEKRGYTVPQIPGSEEAYWILLCRVTPGIPLCIQNYLLGLAGVRFGRYLLLSFPVQAVYAVLFVYFGHTLAQSRLWLGVLCVGALAAAALLLALLRRRFGRGRTRGQREDVCRFSPTQ